LVFIYKDGEPAGFHPEKWKFWFVWPPAGLSRELSAFCPLISAKCIVLLRKICYNKYT